MITGNKTNDKISTPENIARYIINLFPLSGKVLDPFRGKGAFYDNLPETISKDWCEIDSGKDFLIIPIALIGLYLTRRTVFSTKCWNTVLLFQIMSYILFRCLNFLRVCAV